MEDNKKTLETNSKYFNETKQKTTSLRDKLGI